MSKKAVDPRDAVRETLHRLKIHDQPLLIAVSGGADSVALLLLLNELRNERNLTLHIGHFDHNLREESQSDAAWVQSLANRLEIQCTIGRPPATPAIQLTGIEESARKRRYEFLENLAADLKSRWVAVAHTQNDQAETVLHHIARGTGLRGLQGIPEVRGLSDDVSLIRPLLRIERDQLIEALHQANQPYLTDQTNTDSSFTRNRIRHDILPFLKKNLNPQIDQALIRLSQQARAAQSAIEQIAARLLEESTVAASDNSLVRLDTEPFREQPRAVVIAAMILLWEKQNWPRKNMSQYHWDQLFSIIDDSSNANSISCPGGVQATRRRKVLEFKQNHDLQ